MRAKGYFALAAILLISALVEPVRLHVAVSGGAMPMGSSGSWSSGDRLDDTETRRSIGWKKLSSLPPSSITAESQTWSPAVASTSTRTAVMWSPGKADKVVGYLWDRATGTWTSDQAFFTLPLPSAGSFVNSAPALVHRGSNLLDLVVLGQDQYYHAHHSGGKWSPWEPIGGMGGSPAITASKSGAMKLDVWVVAKGSVWLQRWQQATGWQGWKEIGHPQGVNLIAAPGATVRPDNRIDIVAPAQGDGQLWHAHFSAADVFSGWEKIPGKTFTQPVLSSQSVDNLEVLVKGASDGRIFHEVWSGTAWNPFELSINQTPGDQVSFTSGPGANIDSAKVLTVAALSQDGRLLVRSSAATIPSQTTAAPSSVKIRRPSASQTAFVSETAAENTVAIAPGCNAVYLSLGPKGDLQKQKLNCVLNGTGENAQGSFSACDSTSSKSAPGLGSTDNLVTVLKNGTVLWLHQGGGVKTPTGRTGAAGRCRGVENIYFASSCGTNWEQVTLDPCDEKGPFDKSFCNTDSGAAPPCTSNTPLTGTDRPEMLASRHDDSVYIALGVAGAGGKYNLVLLRSSESDLTKWTAMDTGLQSGGASSMAESQTHLYLSRCEYGSPANAGLYAYRKDQPFVAKNLVFLGNIADASCLNGDVQISMMKDSAGLQIVRWVVPGVTGSQQYFKTGFSAITPGGLVTLQTSEVKSGKSTALPTLIALDYNNRALLYWYELGSDSSWRVKGSLSDGIGKWSAPFVLSGSASWLSTSAGPWTKLPVAGHDYMKGYYLLDGKMKFLAQWIQPVSGANEIFYGIVE